MKTITFFFLLGILAFSFPLKMLQNRRQLSPLCNGNGYIWKNQCFCILQYTGIDCSQKKGAEIYDNLSDKCDDLILRLDNLDNISPNFYLFDDDEFPRLLGNAIDGSNSTGSWISKINKNTILKFLEMHDMTEKFHIFSKETSELDIGQGGLGDCYLLAAFASLANRKNGSFLKNMFADLNDNPKHVYVTRWLINGKPRFVAVDDWIPGSSTWTLFSKIGSDQDFWPLILEKAYAKIHGSYKAIEGGWQNSVWSGISSARTFNKWHKDINSTDLYDFLFNLFQKDYVVGAATLSNIAKNEVQNHAYAVLGVYNVILDDNSTVKLVRYYNPWRQEVWDTNPWADNSKNWTQKVKSQVPYIKGNDGIVFSTIEDYHLNFGATNWAEVKDNYDINFIDIAYNYLDSEYHSFEVNFTYYGDNGNDIYIFNDQSNTNLLLACSTPVSISNLRVIDPFGNTFISEDNVVKILNAKQGMYAVKLYVKRNQKFANYFTLTSYSQDGKVNFIPPSQNSMIDIQRKECPNNCNLQGSCNIFEGICTCYFGYEGIDCANIVKKKCDNCNNGVCDTIFGKCIKSGLFNLGVQKYLNKGNGVYAGVGLYEPWEYNSSNGTLQNINTNKNLDIAGNNIEIVINYPYSQNQYWILKYLNLNTFIISSGVRNNFAIITNKNNNYLTLSGLNISDINQHWIFKVESMACPNNCSARGVCSFSTGICVCSTGFIGDSCELEEIPIQCDKNCSNHGLCDFKTGYCNCQKEYVGDACDIFSQDIFCPQNCSNNGICSLEQGKCLCSNPFSGFSCEVFSGKIMSSLLNVYNNKYLTVDTSTNIIFSNTIMKWNLTEIELGQIIYPVNRKVLYIKGGVFKAGTSIILNSVDNSIYQQWIYEKKNDYYIIRSAGNLQMVISINSLGKSISLAKYIEGDNKQKWKLVY